LLADNGLHAINHKGESQWFFASKDKSWTINGETWGWGNQQVKDIWAWYRSAPTIANDKIIFGNANGTFAVSKSTGKQIWHVDTGVTHTKPAYENNVVVVGSWNNNLYGIDVEQGKITWQFSGRIPQGSMNNWDGWNGFNLSPIIHENTVYVGNRGSYFYAIDLEKGIEKWSSQYAATWVGSPAVEHNGEVYFGTSDGFSLVGLNAERGAQTLLFLNDFYNFAQPQVNNSTVYFGSVSGEVYAVDRKSMQGKKIFSTPESVQNYAEMVKEEGGVKNLYSNGADYNYVNSVKDINRMHVKLNAILSMTLSEDTLYVGTVNGTLYALSL
jgi:outer membrane protein assembly factor BamB